MSDIPPIGATGNVVLSLPEQEPRPGEIGADAGTDVDSVEISELAQVLSTLDRPGDIRADKVAAVREAIQNGTYETDDKLEYAMDRLLVALRSPETPNT